ncbi:MAG: tetratricopeptide repeat protein [bacterium]
MRDPRRSERRTAARRPWRATLWALCLTLLAGCTATPEEYLEAAREAGSRREAIRLLTRAVEGDPQFAPALRARARLHAETGAFDKSVADYDRLLDLLENRDRPSTQTTRQRADILYMRGKVQELAGRLPQAAESYTKALAADPALTTPFQDRAWVYLKMGKYARAMQDYVILLGRDPGHLPDEARARRAQLRFRRGVAAFCSRQWESALSDFEVAFRQSRAPARKTRALLNLYFIVSRIGDKEQAERALATYAEETRKQRATDTPWIFTVLWYLEGRLKEGSLLDAAKHTNAQVQAERTAVARYYIGARRLVDGDRAGAIDAFKKCVAHEDRSLVEYHMAKVELRRIQVGGMTAEDYKAKARRAKTHEEKIKLYSEAIRVNPRDPEARLQRAILYALTGKHELALADYDRLLELARLPENRAQVLRYRGWTHAQSGQYEKAVSDYTAALELEPDSWRAREGLAVALCYLRKYAQAAEVYGELVTKVVADRSKKRFWEMQRAFANACRGEWEAAARGLRSLIPRAGDPAILRANLYVVEWKLGDGERATEKLKTFARRIKKQTWPSSVVWYLADMIDAKKLLEASMHEDKAEHALRSSRACYYIGERSLAQGKEKKAIEYLKSCVRLGGNARRESWEYRLALAELERLAKK